MKTDIARLVRATDDGPEVQVVIDWLVQIGERHHLGIAPPSQAQAAAILPLLDVLSREFRDYRDVVARSRNAARRNAEQLAEVVRSSSEQGVLVRATAQAAAGAGSGASLMTGVADALGRFAQAAAGAATDAGDSLGAIDAALGQLKGRLSEGDAPLIVMRTSTAGVAAFLSTLGRLSRHAQLLGVNASIEAAHLAEAGSRFGIVAQEVRKLSASTRESKADVALIVGELREATEQVAVAVQDSKETTTAAGREIGGAGEALGQTARGIAELQQMVADVADVAMNQQGALEAICSSVDQISHHAEGLASAAQTAAQLDLGSLLDHAHARVSRWSLYERKAGPSATSDAFGRWIATLVGGMDPKAPADVDADADMRPLVAAVRTLLERISGEQRDILGDVIEVAVAVARNSFAWRSIAEALGGVSSQIALVRAAVGESAGAARTSAELAGGMGSLVEAMRLQYDTALQLLEGALTRISRIAGSVAQIDGFVESMDAAALRADRIMALIETLSAETDLLSLNAAIEAAHAGELGRGFSVIAEEIGSLARSTNESTANVSQLVSTISRISSELQTSIGAAAASMTDVAASAETVRNAIASLRGSFESATEQARGVLSNAAEQTRALDLVLDNVNRSSAAVDQTAGRTMDDGRLELAMLGSRAHAIAARRPHGTYVERVHAFTESVAIRLEATMEAAVAARQVTLDQLFTFAYEPITGTRIASLGRLFDVSRVPDQGFAPAKFATPWDSAIDEAVIDVLTRAWDEAARTDFKPIGMFVADLNGLFYAYPRQKIAAWTGDPVADNMGNRIKRFFEDEYTLRVVRCGLGLPADSLGTRRSYEAFRAAGCELTRTADRPWGGYVYARDTSIVCNEVVVALYVGGRRHGALRVCYDPSLI